jgi:protein tyrosine phosphatase (PTP) superfamily phosphohydrolase (DUF442 family)
MRLPPLALAAVAVAAAGTVGIAAGVRGPLHTYLFESNLMPVVEGQFYRSAQPSPEDLADWIQSLGIRSVLNLRGERGGSGWLEKERRITSALGVAHYDVHLDADRMPPAPRLREVVEILDRAPRPLLFHCKGGVERSGLVGAAAVLLAGGDLAAARREFAASKGFLPWVASSDLPRVLDDYERWLAAQGAATTAERFREWVASDYVPGYYRAEITALDAPAAEGPQAPRVLRFRVTNRSGSPIPFSSETGRGVHLGALLRPAEGAAAPPLELRGAPLDLHLEPGASTEIALLLPPLSGEGPWQLEVDLVDEGVEWFSAMGSPPLALAVQR